MSGQFGRLIRRGQLQRAIIDTLEMWLPTYLGEVERQAGVPANDYLRTWSAGGVLAVSEAQKRDEDRLPCVLVTLPLTTRSVQRGSAYSYTYAVTVAPVVSARDEAQANELVDAYAAAIRGVLVQKGSLGGFASNTVPSSSPEPDAGLAMDENRTKQLMTMDFEVTVNDVVTFGLGPITPGDPGTTNPGDYPVVDNYDANVDVEEDPS